MVFFKISQVMNFPVHSSIQLGINLQLKQHTAAWLVFLHFEAKELGYSCCIPSWLPTEDLPSFYQMSLFAITAWREKLLIISYHSLSRIYFLHSNVAVFVSCSVNEGVVMLDNIVVRISPSYIVFCTSLHIPTKAGVYSKITN